MQTLHRVFTAVLTDQDMKKHIPFPVQVPLGTRSLSIRMSYAPHIVEQVHNLLTLTVLDPAGFRGAAHRNAEVMEITIQDNAASPGFFPGPVQPGEWTVLVDTHMIMPGAPIHLELAVAGADQLDPALSSTPTAEAPAARPGRGPGWYRGDFHTHTIHSDGDWDVADLVRFALDNQLDFITLSDHNTVTGLRPLERLCPESLLPICGIELTTFWGHALVLGRREWVDWRIEPGRREMAQVVAEVEAQGGLFVIAHPEAIGDPFCTGCSWLYPDVRPGAARVVEVWNSPWGSSDSRNEAGLELAFEWMSRGLRMVLTAGTDRHNPRYPAPGHAFNTVYAEELSEAAILRAVRLGHLVLSSGPTLTLSARADGGDLMPGDSCRAQAGETIRISAKWGGCPPGSHLDLVVDGEKRETTGGGPSAIWDLPGGQTGWALLTLRDPDGEMLALTNPIYFDGR
jgi:hypothetical protein